MLNFGNKEFRNLQEQVLENMKNISSIEELVNNANLVGIRVLGIVKSVEDLPVEAEEGDMYAVGTEVPYELYVFNTEWVDFCEFPLAGPQGETGATGPQGPKGDIGPAGPKGDKGDQGPQGPRGLQGEKGEPGPRGYTGADGADGKDGYVKSFVENAEAVTEVGEAYVDSEGHLQVCTSLDPLTFSDAGSIKGPQGEQGIQGEQGPKGDTGAKGATGETGPQGERGPRGFTGPQGEKGDKGEQGATGPQGPQGLRGEKGADGATGPKGDTGAQGPKGDAGEPVTITVNNVTYTSSEGNITLPDYPADVAWGNITGTLSEQIDLQTALNNKVGITNNETISGQKTFTPGIKLGAVASPVEIATSRAVWTTPVNGKVTTIEDQDHLDGIGIKTTISFPEDIDEKYGVSLLPKSTAQRADLGDSDHLWRDIYLSGAIKSSSQTISIDDLENKVELHPNSAQSGNPNIYNEEENKFINSTVPNPETLLNTDPFLQFGTLNQESISYSTLFTTSTALTYLQGYLNITIPDEYVDSITTGHFRVKPGTLSNVVIRDWTLPNNSRNYWWASYGECIYNSEYKILSIPVDIESSSWIGQADPISIQIDEAIITQDIDKIISVKPYFGSSITATNSLNIIHQETDHVAGTTEEKSLVINKNEIRLMNDQKLMSYKTGFTAREIAAPDNKAIKLDSDGYLTTTIGGYTETLSRDYVILSNSSENNQWEWDLYNSTVAARAFNSRTGFKADTRYDIELSGDCFADDCTITEAYLYFTNVSSDEIGTGENALYITFEQNGNTWSSSYEFYIMGPNATYPNRIHVYSNSSNPFKYNGTGTKLNIKSSVLGSMQETIVHKIDSTYLPAVAIDPNGFGLNINSEDQLWLKLSGTNGIFVYDNTSWDSGTEIHGKTIQIGLSENKNNTLSIQDGNLLGTSTPRKTFEIRSTQRSNPDSETREIDITNTELATAIIENINNYTSFSITKSIEENGQIIWGPNNYIGGGQPYVGSEDEYYIYYWFSVYPATIYFKKSLATDTYSDFILTITDEGYDADTVVFTVKFANYEYYEKLNPDLLPDSVVTTDTAQTITGTKSWITGANALANPVSGSNLRFKGSATYSDDISVSLDQDFYRWGMVGSTYAAGTNNGIPGWVIEYDSTNNIWGFLPRQGVDLNLGAINGPHAAAWNNLYLSGNISDGTNSVTPADLAALITYAKGQGWIS